MNLRRTRAVARKEFLHIIRDPRSLIMALAIPFTMLLLFGFALSLDVDEIPTVVLDADRSPQSRELLDRFESSKYFTVQDVVTSYREIELRIDRGEALLAVVIPGDYSEDLARSREAAVQLVFDGSDSNTASIALGYADGILATHSLQLNDKGGSPRSPIEPEVRVWYNSTLESKNFIIPGLIAVILMIISALLTSLTIAREWEMGTMEQILSTPLRPSEMVLGKMVAFFILGLVNAATAVTVGLFVFDVPLRGNLLLLFTTTCVFLFGSLCWGMLLSAIARSQLLAFQMGIMSSFLPAFLLSGFIFAIENMPEVIQVISHIVPARYFVTILKGIFLKGVGTEVLFLEIGFLILYSAFVFVAATRKVGSKLA